MCRISAAHSGFPSNLFDSLTTAVSSYGTSRAALSSAGEPQSVRVATEVLRESERLKEACLALLRAATREHEAATRVLESAIQHREQVLNKLRKAVDACHIALSTATERVVRAVATNDAAQVLEAVKHNRDTEARGTCQLPLQHALDACGAVDVDVDHLGSLDSEADTTVVRNGVQMMDTLRSYVAMEARLPDLIQVW